MFNASLLHYLPWGAGHVVGVLTPRANPPQNPKIGSRAHHVMWCTSCGTCWTFFPEVVHPRPFGLHLFNTREGMELLGTCQFRHSNSVHFKFVVFRPQDFMNFLTFWSCHATSKGGSSQAHVEFKGGGISIGLSMLTTIIVRFMRSMALPPHVWGSCDQWLCAPLSKMIHHKSIW